MIVTNITDDVVDNAEVETRLAKSPEAKPMKAPSQNTPPGGSTRYSQDAITDRNVQGQQQNSDQKSAGQGKGESKKASQSESKP
jgi:hypothetical protein